MCLSANAGPDLESGQIFVGDCQLRKCGPRGQMTHLVESPRTFFMFAFRRL